MKTIRLFFLPAFWAFVQVLAAQPLPYQYALSKEPFAPLDSATVFPLSIWNGESVDVPLGFPFKYGVKTFSTLGLAPYEGGLFGGGADTLQAIFGYFADAGLGFKPDARISYKTEGIAPNRIFKAEWLNVAFGNGGGDVSMQIWLYETVHVIQIRLGPQIVPDPGNVFGNQISPLIGLAIDMISNSINDSTLIRYGHWITGEAQFPGDTISLDQQTLEAPQFGCNGIPLEDAVFTFTPGNVTAAAMSATTEALRFFPNPAVDRIRFARPMPSDALVQILDMQGNLLFSNGLAAGSETLPLPAGLMPGTYLVRSVEAGTVGVGKLMLR